MYIQKELIKDIDSLLKLVDKYKDEFDSKFIFSRSGQVRKYTSSILSPIHDHLLSHPVMHFSELYGVLLNDMKRCIHTDFAEFANQYRIYVYYVIGTVTWYTIINKDEEYSYYDYIYVPVHDDVIRLAKRDKPLFDKDPDLGIFFLAFTKTINNVSARIKKVHKDVNGFSENLIKDILSSSINLCNDEELNEYFSSICEFAKNYKKEGN